MFHKLCLSFVISLSYSPIIQGKIPFIVSNFDLKQILLKTRRNCVRNTLIDFGKLQRKIYNLGYE